MDKYGGRHLEKKKPKGNFAEACFLALYPPPPLFSPFQEHLGL